MPVITRRFSTIDEALQHLTLQCSLAEDKYLAERTDQNLQRHTRLGDAARRLRENPQFVREKPAMPSSTSSPERP